MDREERTARSRRSAEIALYLLPNAKSIRLVESGSLLHLLHKWTMRTCFNAQEEIYQASIEEVEQVREVLPRTRALHRPAVLSPRRNLHSDLHRRLALLRRKSLARFPQHPATNLIGQVNKKHDTAGSLIYYLTAWICGCFFMGIAIWIRDLWGSTVTSPRSHEAFGVLFFSFLAFSSERSYFVSAHLCFVES